MALLLFLAAAWAPAQVIVTHDLDFVPPVEYPNGQDRLDIYAPVGARGAPVILMFHGGGLTGGDRKDERAFGYRLAEAGYIVVAANYRLSPVVRHPAHVEDAAWAFEWVRRYIAGWGGDPDRIYVAGYSAGAYLAALLGTDAQYLAAHDRSPREIAGLILIAATFNLARRPAAMRAPWGDDPHVLNDASPLRHVGPGMPRTLMIVGDQDEPWRLADHREAAAAVRSAGKTDLVLKIVRGRNHATIRRAEGEEQAPETIAAILDFAGTAGGRDNRALRLLPDSVPQRPAEHPGASGWHPDDGGRGSSREERHRRVSSLAVLLDRHDAAEAHAGNLRLAVGHRDEHDVPGSRNQHGTPCALPSGAHRHVVASGRGGQLAGGGGGDR